MWRSQNPLPMDVEILSKIIKALPKSSNLQVLRMKDHDNGKGSPLAIQSSTFASLRENIPPSLKVLQWEIENSIVRYKFEPGQSVRIVDPPEQCQWPDALLWTDASILKHLRNWSHSLRSVKSAAQDFEWGLPVGKGDSWSEAGHTRHCTVDDYFLTHWQRNLCKIFQHLWTWKF